MSKNRSTIATYPNVSRSRCKLSKRQRRLAAASAVNQKALEEVKKLVEDLLKNLDERMKAIGMNPDPTIYDEKEEASFDIEMAEIKAKNDIRIDKKRNRLSRTARGRKQLIRKDAKIEAWATRLANDVANLTD